MPPREPAIASDLATSEGSKDPPSDKGFLSSLGIRYPTLRDHPLHTGHQWLEGKRADDGAEGLWRIHDGLYDFRQFIAKHPGGEEWLSLTQGTDITEAFHSHHISSTPHSILSEYYIRPTSCPRNSPFTFHEDGFYCTLRKRVSSELQTLPQESARRSRFLTDLLLAGYLSAAVLAAGLCSYILGVAAGVLLGLTAIAAHNYFHQKDNFRMYYFDFTMMNYREWRISHALSHHLYTNTINDMEISSLEPFLQYLPSEKAFFFKYLSCLYSPIVYSLMFFGHYIKTFIQIALNKGKGFGLELLLPLSVPILMKTLTGQSILYCLQMYVFIQVCGSIYFSIVGVNAAHHHPDIFHDGDTPRPKEEMDWGLYQLDAVMDRKDITGSHFLVLTNFGDHALHHLFPTIDHGLLEYLYPVFLKTCDEFGIEWRLSSQIELVKGQYRQLMKTEPSKHPPKPVKKVR